MAVLGFDGMDPTLARRLMDEGKLPHLKRLAEMGTFSKLETTQPSESPVAWASFATGVNPGKHNIYDFLVRDFETYMPDLGGVKKEPPKFLWGWLPTQRPKITSTRGGTSFWIHAGRAGLRSRIVTVPITFPPELIEHGEMLAGLPLPDLRGTLGTYGYWATDLSRFEEGPTEFGGITRRLAFTGDTADTELVNAPPNPIVRQQIEALTAAGKPTDATRATLAEFQGAPAKICHMYRDLNPSAGGAVYFKTDATKSVVTVNAVPCFGGACGPNTIQIHYFATGRICLLYNGVPAQGGWVGISPGSGSATAVDLSQGGTCGSGGCYESFGGTIDMDVGVIDFTPDGAGGYTWEFYMLPP